MYIHKPPYFLLSQTRYKQMLDLFFPISFFSILFYYKEKRVFRITFIVAKLNRIRNEFCEPQDLHISEGIFIFS